MNNSRLNTDKELFQQFRAGDEQAFTTVYKLLYQRVYWFARKYLEAAADAQDLTAETFVQLWQHRNNFFDLDGVAAFLHVTVRNKCFNLLKHERMKSSHQQELLQLLEAPDTDSFFIEQVRIDLMKRIYAEVERLPARMKEVFLLSYQEGLKPAQIAERLQIKVQTVTNQRVSAIKLLKLALNKEPLILILLTLLEQENHFFS